MSKKTTIFAAVVLVLALALSACERSASNAPLAATATTGPGEPAATSNDPMAMLRAFATQTALAMSGGAQATPAPAAETPVPGSSDAATPFIQLTPQPTTAVVATTQVPTPVSSTAIPAANEKPSSYTLQEGEYPYCIARRFNVNPDELLSINGLGGGGLYVPGLLLKIPQTGNTFPGVRSLKTRPASYTVAAYDTIYKIACAYGDLDPLTIASANSLVAPYTLKTGQTISIP
jgi:LysM repeat protein